MEMLYSLKEKYTCYFIRGNKEDYWLNRKYNNSCEWKEGNITVGVPLRSGGKTQFMILHREGDGWKPEFISLDYDRERVLRELQESGLNNAAPYWSKVTAHLILTGEISHGTVLTKAMELSEKDGVACKWYNVPERYWEQAIAELLSL